FACAWSSWWLSAGGSWAGPSASEPWPSSSAPAPPPTCSSGCWAGAICPTTSASPNPVDASERSKRLGPSTSSSAPASPWSGRGNNCARAAAANRLSLAQRHPVTTRVAIDSYPAYLPQSQPSVSAHRPCRIAGGPRPRPPLPQENQNEQGDAHDVAPRRRVSQEQPAGDQSDPLPPRGGSQEPAPKARGQGDDAEDRGDDGQDDCRRVTDQEQRHAFGRQAKHEGHNERRQGVAPRGPHDLVRVAARDGRYREAREGRRRRHLRKHRVVEDEHVGGGLGHAHLVQ